MTDKAIGYVKKVPSYWSLMLFKSVWIKESSLSSTKDLRHGNNDTLPFSASSFAKQSLVLSAMILSLDQKGVL